MEIAKDDAKEAKKKSNSSVIIDRDLHAKMKKHCVGNSRKIGGVIENLIRLYLANPKEIENAIDNLKEN